MCETVVQDVKRISSIPVQEDLIGDDEPGSSVKLGIRCKNGGTSVILTRMDSAVVSDKRRVVVADVQPTSRRH
jgi:hypothetical protein